MARQISASTEWIAELIARRRVRDGVDGEVASREVFVERRTELDLGVPAIGLDVAPERRHLVQRPFAIEHSDRSELNADRNRAPFAEDRPHLIGCCRGREVPIQMWMTKYCVAHRAADAPCLVPFLLEPLGDLEHSFGWIEARHRTRRAGLGHLVRAWTE